MAVAALLAALAMAVASLDAWFTAVSPRGPVRVSGVDAAPVLWVVVAAAAPAVLVAAGIALRRIAPGRIAGGLVAAMGGVGVLWTVRTLVRPPVMLTARLPEGPRSLDAPVERLAAGYLAAVAAGLLVAAGLVLAVRGERGR